MIDKLIERRHYTVIPSDRPNAYRRLHQGGVMSAVTSHDCATPEEAERHIRFGQEVPHTNKLNCVEQEPGDPSGINLLLEAHLRTSLPPRLHHRIQTPNGDHELIYRLYPQRLDESDQDRQLHERIVTVVCSTRPAGDGIEVRLTFECPPQAASWSLNQALTEFHNA